MSRSTQFIGHTDQAKDFIHSCECIGESGQTVEGMFGEDVHFCRLFKDKQGNVWEEFEQFSPWSSGPMIFLGIKRLNKSTGEVNTVGWERASKDLKSNLEYDERTGLIFI